VHPLVAAVDKQPSSSEVFEEVSGRPGQCALTTRFAAAGELMARLQDVLCVDLTAEIEECCCTELRITANVFSGYVMQGLEARVASSGLYGATAWVRSTTPWDVVRFHRIVDLLAAALETRGLKVDITQPSVPAPTFCEFYWDADMEDGAEPLRSEQLRLLLANALDDAGRAEVRKEAAQALAHWAEACPGCVLSLAQVMAEQQSSLLRTLRAAKGERLAEAYPLAAALHRAVASSPEAAAVFAAGPLCHELGTVAVAAPRIMAMELQGVAGLLDLAHFEA